MDFESPDAMKDFPGLYVYNVNKMVNNDSDYSDETDKITKKDLLIGKRRDKKDKKDKERGYAALEGESSADETYDARSPSKSKKSKSFKFTSKSKEKREKSRDKEELVDKKKEKEKKLEKKLEKEKKSDKKERKAKHSDEHGDIAERLPIFGVNLDLAVERSRCHDGIDLPLPMRLCIDYVELYGLAFEGVYKITGTKSKVLQLRKMFNYREDVDLRDYDTPTVTSLMKMFLRDLPEPLFTNDLLIRFEEAGAILNAATREKHLGILMENLPPNNRLLLSWLLVHLDNVVVNEKLNKMNAQSLTTVLSPVLHVSTRLLTALMYHCRNLFPSLTIKAYFPPLTSTARLPDEPQHIEAELMKQESLLSQIHDEVHIGSIPKRREELMWEVQRIITQLKRKYKNVQRDKDHPVERVPDERMHVIVESEVNDSEDADKQESEEHEGTDTCDNANTSEQSSAEGASYVPECEKVLPQKNHEEQEERTSMDDAVNLMQFKNNCLMEMRDKLYQLIENEKREIAQLKAQLVDEPSENYAGIPNNSPELNEIMDLLSKENQILQITKINLVRQIMEQQEICIDMKAKINLHLQA